MRLRFRTLLVALCFTSPAMAAITGGKDEPMSDRGFPSGSVPLANLKTRLAWWEGPPFGGGQYHFEYSGKTVDLQAAIDLFAKIDAPRKRVVVRADERSSFWLGVVDKGNKHPVDWQFVVWIPKNWEHLHQARAGFLPPGEEGDGPLTLLEVFLTDRIEWESLEIPAGLTIVDERLEANGIAADQGAALQGTVLNSSGSPITGARVTLGEGESQRSGTSDDMGRFLITKIPKGNHRITVAADGFASKDAYFQGFTSSTYRRMEVMLAKAAAARVRVVDEEGNSLPDVEIRVSNCQDKQGNHYRTVGKQQYKSDQNGEFLLRDIPEGKVKFSSRSPGYYYNSVLNEHDTTDSLITIKLQPTGTLRVYVVTSAGKPVVEKYIVEIAEEGVDLREGGGVGSWGGSANIREDGTYLFEGIPPGRYVVSGQPNPGRRADRTDPIVVEIKGKKLHAARLVAK